MVTSALGIKARADCLGEMDSSDSPLVQHLLSRIEAELFDPWGIVCFFSSFDKLWVPSLLARNVYHSDWLTATIPLCTLIN